MFSNFETVRLRAERLEDRDVPSVTASLVGSTLVLQADNAGDAILVTQERGQVVVNGLNTTISTSPNGTTPGVAMGTMAGMGMGMSMMTGMSPMMTTPTPMAGAHRVPYAAGTVKAIEFIGGAGNDIFINATSVNAFAQGGPGNDILVGGSGHDTLMGGPGNDVLIGGLGTSVLFGGPGRDLFIRGPGHSIVADANAAEGDVVL